MLEAVGVEVVKKGIEAAGKEIMKKAADASIVNKIMQMPDTVQGMKEAFKTGVVVKEGIKKGAELVYDHEAKDDPDLADLKSAIKMAEGLKKGLVTDIAEKLKQMPETVQGMKETIKTSELVKEMVKTGAELIYDHEAEDDPDLADMKRAFKMAEGLKKDLGADIAGKLVQAPETAQGINQVLMEKDIVKMENINRPELSQDKKIKQQDQSISEIENGEKKIESTQEKGNFGEMKTDQDLRGKGYERISKDMITNVNNSGHPGIDGVYRNPDGMPPYLIVDAKYGTGQLSDTVDGKQMSENWIDKRLDESVGKEMADEIRMEKLLNPDNVGSYISHVDEKGNVSYDKLNGNADIIEKDVKI